MIVTGRLFGVAFNNNTRDLTNNTRLVFVVLYVLRLW